MPGSRCALSPLAPSTPFMTSMALPASPSLPPSCLWDTACSSPVTPLQPDEHAGFANHAACLWCAAPAVNWADATCGGMGWPRVDGPELWQGCFQVSSTAIERLALRLVMQRRRGRPACGRVRPAVQPDTVGQCNACPTSGLGDQARRKACVRPSWAQLGARGLGLLMVACIG